MDGVLKMQHATNPCWSVIELTKNGPESRYLGRDFEESRSVYASLANAIWTEVHGRDENCNTIPGQMMQNIHLGRKFHGVEQL